MALPQLRDYLPSHDLVSGFDLEIPDVERAIARAHAALDDHEAKLRAVERHVGTLRASVDQFVSDLESASDMNEEHIEEAVRQLAEERARNEGFCQEHARGFDKARKEMQKVRNPDLRHRSVAYLDRASRATRSAVTIFDLAIRRLLELRDRLLVQEAQHLSMSAFWGDDD